MESKSRKIKILHIAIIILGTIFIALSIFHSNTWFDESYSVGMARHSFSDIWQIGANDVHPILYYFCLHSLYLVFGNNIIVYRLFSVITIALLGLLGFTHIRKDFGEKTGILFSFLAMFLPVSCMYAGEIRMYSLGLLLGTIMAIYAYRIYNGNISKTTYIFFGLSSLAVSYTHYYGLMFAGIVNLILFIYLIKNRKERGTDLKKFIITAVLQVIAYMPWLLSFIKQIKGVSSGFWISLSFPGTLIEVITMQYIGNIPQMLALVLSVALYIYVGYLIYKRPKKERKLPKICFEIYIGIILIALLISLCMMSVILLNRYLLIITGLIIFALAYLMAEDKNKYRIITVCMIILLVSGYSNIKNIEQNYDENNPGVFEYITSKIQPDDIILYSNVISGANITIGLPESIDNKTYFYNEEKWSVHEAYKAFETMEIIENLDEVLENYKGRIWLVEDKGTNKLYEQIAEKYEITKIEEKEFTRSYRDICYTIELVEK